MNRRGPIIAGAIVLLVAVLAVFLLVLPKMSEVGETEDRLQDTRGQEINLAARLNARGLKLLDEVGDRLGLTFRGRAASCVVVGA